VDHELMRTRLAAARVAHLATTSAAGQPHVVPCCFVLHCDEMRGDVLYSAVDAKPKSTQRLKRIVDIEANPHASLVVDHYEEDWTRLWWVRVDGTARIVAHPAEHEAGLDLLAAKYAQYRATRPPGPVIALDVRSWKAWAGDGSGAAAASRGGPAS
jgi:PPOX class probable F420-dependent enzyme